jgi:glutamate 5-kinase
MVEASAPNAAGLIRKARRIAVKVGSSLLVGGEGLRAEWVRSLGSDLGELRGEGKELLLVSSGAVALGRGALGRTTRLDGQQAAAAIGQPLLMQAWQEAMAQSGLSTAQLLLTLEDTESRRRWLNARATLEVLLRHGALPVINENDTVATEELRYGDNDRLSARVAQMARCDVLILLSDVDGLYTADPAANSDATHVPVVTNLREAREWASGSSSSGMGSGGMRTKLDAAWIAQRAGCATIIATGRGLHPLRRLATGEGRSTVVTPHGSPGGAYKQWIVGTLSPSGSVTVDEGAATALGNGKSLLPAGVVAVAGEFAQGSCLAILNGDGHELGRGIARYASEEASRIIGLRGAEIAAKLGYSRGDELVHRDDLVLL